jgi:acyl-CoA synthetase (AMP-forming)/AMP-acid ligase II
VGNEPEHTEKNFPGGWWKSGEVLYRDRLGYYYFAGRSDHMFKSGGIKIFSEEVEGNLKRHPAVLDAVVVAIPHETFGFSPFAHIRNSEPLTAEVMERWWEEQNFGRYMRPKKWKFWGKEEFPVIGMQKIDRKRLQQQALEE